MNRVQSLEVLLEEKNRKYSLEESAEVMKKILYALDRLHQNGHLHLAVCPENILLFPERVVLLHQKAALPYIAPEVRLNNLSEIGPASDIYSACAVFFRLVMKRRLREEEVIGMGLYRCFWADQDVFFGDSEELKRRTVKILFRGLHTLPRKRYASAAALLSEMEGLCEAVR